MIALIPAYSHVDHRLMGALAQAEVPYQPLYECSDLPRARSQLLTHGLEATPAKRFLLVDSDVTPTAKQILALLGSPRLGPRDIVVGTYATRDGRVSCIPLDLTADVQLFTPGLVELAHSGLGFCAITREALHAIAETLPLVTNGQRWRPFCVPFVEDGTYYADDYAFFERARRAGCRVWLDTELVVSHVMRAPRILPNLPVSVRG